MKPVRVCEIAVSEGEFPYRKSGKAEPVACGVSRRHQSSYVGLSEIMG